MNVNPPVATELWQQVPPPVQSALLEAWEQAERQRHSLEDQLREIRSRLNVQEGIREGTPPLAGPSLPPLENSEAIPASHDTRLSRGHRRRRHRPSPVEKLERRHDQISRLLNTLLWPALLVAGVLVLWGVLQFINPGAVTSFRRHP